MNCDIFQCLRMWAASDESCAFAAEKNAEQLGAVYESHVMETQKTLDAALVGSRSVLETLRVARSNGNAVAIARAQTAAHATAARVRELRATMAKHELLQNTCKRAADNLREARMHRSTVNTLSDVQRQFKSMQLDGIAVATERTVADLASSTDMLVGVRELLAQPALCATGAVDADADIAELEAFLAIETPAPVSAPAPTPQTMAALPTAEAYAASLLVAI